MSSATSINRRGLKTPPLQPPSDGFSAARTEDAGCRPWHFFLLASILLATVAVMLARQSSPENLILISLTVASAGAAAAAFYRMLAPLTQDVVLRIGEPVSERTRTALEREKMLVLRSIKELEFDRAMGKLSPKDFDEMSVRLRTRAIALMKQLDEGGDGYREVIERELRARLGATAKTVVTTAACGGCGTTNDHDAAFCKRCGAKL